MSDTTHNNGERTGLYRFTSIARPIDPSYLTNRALLYALPVLGVLGAVVAVTTGQGDEALRIAFTGMLVSFIAWAFTRDLAPDYVETAFVALGLAWLGSLAFGTDKVLVVFAVLLLLRVVNRTTGLPLTWFDTASVLGFVGYTSMQTGQPLLVLLMALAFALDGLLHQPLRRHLAAAAVCLPLFAWLVANAPGFALVQLALVDWVLLALALLGGAVFVVLSPEPISYYDNAYDRLDLGRVNASFLIGLLAGLQAVVTLGPTAWFETPIWACLFAVLLSFVVRKFFDWKATVS